MQKKNNSGIYCIENIITGKKYIGQSKDITARWKKHKNELKNNLHHNDYLQKAWNKYGEDNFKFYVVELCTINMLDEREIYYIKLYNTMNQDCGYNLKSGGQLSSNYYSEETRKKMSESIRKSYQIPERRDIQRINAIKQWSNPTIKEKITGINNYMYGKHHTDKTKEKISKMNKGRTSARRNTTRVYCIDLDQEFKDASEAGKVLHLDSSSILKVCQGKRKTCGKYKWKFIDNRKII